LICTIWQEKKKREKGKERRKEKKGKKSLEGNSWHLQRLQINHPPLSHLCDVNFKELKLKEKCI